MSINQSIKPITTEVKGNICIGDCDLVELAHKYGTPLYVIDEATLRGICINYLCYICIEYRGMPCVPS